MAEPHVGGPTLNLTVVSRKALTRDVVEVEFARADGGDLPAWEPGAHIDLLLEAGLIRQYSLCGDLDDHQRWRIAVLLEPTGRGGSKRVHALVPGDTVTVAGPRNHFALEPSPGYLFIAGGIGITPLLPMIQEAERGGAEWRLVYGGRTRTSMAYGPELQHNGADRVTLAPQDELGLIDLPALLGAPQADVLVYACGPTPLLDAVSGFEPAWPHGAIHMERFTPKALEQPVRTENFTVVLERSGIIVEVPPDRSILDQVLAAGVDVEWSCNEGICGSCEVHVLAGRPDHRDSVLSDDQQEAGRTMMICVSRCLTAELRLDV